MQMKRKGKKKPKYVTKNAFVKKNSKQYKTKLNCRNKLLLCSKGEKSWLNEICCDKNKWK